MNRLAILLIFLPAFAFGQATETISFLDDEMVPIYIISFIIFIAFNVLLWWTYRADRKFIKKVTGILNTEGTRPPSVIPYKLTSHLQKGKRNIFWITALVFFPWSLFAQTTAQKTFWDDPFSDPMMPIYVVSVLVFITVLLVLITAVYMLRILNLMVRKQAEEKATREGRVYVPELSWWNKFWDSFNASVPLTKESDIDLGHDYDGIRELDNHLPPWWKGILYFTIVWGVIYMFMYHVSFSLPLSGEEYNNEVTKADEAKRALLASQPAAVIDPATLVYDANAEYIAKGKAVFTGNNCQSCHRDDGGGNAIGPNLTDNFWLHGGSIKDVFTTIDKGFLEKGMPAWGKVMSPTDVRNVTFYVMSLRGTNPPNAKAPQGVEYKPEEATPKADTTVTAQIR